MFLNHLPSLQVLLTENGWDALLLTSEVCRRYATGFHSSAGMVVILKDVGHYFTDFRYIDAARAQVTDFTVTLVGRERNYKELVGKLLAERNVKTLGFEQNEMTVSQYELLRQAWPNAAFVPAGDAIDALRRVKTEAEIQCMEKAQRIAEQAFTALLPLIEVGMTERQVSAQLIYQMLRAGADNTSFDPIVVAGPNSALPHGEPGDRPIQKGDFLTIDFGVLFKGYCSDTTRTVAIGEATDEMRKVYDVVLAAQLAGIDSARGGVKGVDIHMAGQRVIEEAGYGAYFGHGFGHGIGMEVHEPGGASPLDNSLLPVGMAISAEPGIYLPGRFGVRIEDVIVLTENGCRNLTTLPKELQIL